MSTIFAALCAVRPARLLTALVAVAGFAVLSSGSARAEYPDHPVTIVACFLALMTLAIKLSIFCRQPRR